MQLYIGFTLFLQGNFQHYTSLHIYLDILPYSITIFSMALDNDRPVQAT